MTKTKTKTTQEPERHILLVEDDSGLSRQMRWALSPFTVVTAASREEALEAFQGNIKFSIVILDLGLPPDRDGTSEGLATLDTILSAAPQTKVMILSGNADRAAAVSAVGRGAFDFLSKPVEIDVLKLAVERAAQMYDLEDENRVLRGRSDAGLPGIVFSSSEMGQVARTVERVARTNASVMIIGESGTGKELIASALHQMSDRSDARLVAINCASIPENLLESELFGHERGAFTGAVKQTLGKFELANKGTLFLDEIGDMPLALQAKLLRFLQSHEFERVGGRTTLSVDVRVVAATNKPLETLIPKGEFREDLFFRLNEIRLELPPLRKRVGDTVILAQHFCNIYARENRRNLRGFTKEALLALNQHAWPGNVRELENRMKRAVIMADGPMITAGDLELAGTGSPTNLDLRDHVQNLENSLLSQALTASGGNVSRAAKLMGISRPQVYHLIKTHKPQLAKNLEKP